MKRGGTMESKSKVNARTEADRLKAIVDGAGDIIILVDKGGRITQANKTFEDITKYSRRRVIGKNIFKAKIFTPNSKKIALDNHKKRFSGMKTTPYEIELISKDKKVISTEVNATIIDLGNNNFMELIIFRDITYRKKAEKELKDSEEKFRTIFEDSNDGILVAELKTKSFIVANPAICRITGYSAENLLKLGVNDMHPKKDLPYVLDCFRKQARKEMSIAKDIPVLRKDGTVVYCDVNSSFIRLNEKDAVVGFFRDITERRKADISEMKKIKSLEDFKKFSINREMKMIELKKRIMELEGK